MASGSKPSGLAPGRLPDRRDELGVVGGGELAVRVLDDRDPRDPQGRRREGEAPLHVVGDAGAGVAEDLGVAGLEPEHGERIDPRVDARHDGERPCGPRPESATLCSTSA